ncbi:MAG: hypothetical protein FRX49_10414 [Trebouxia sp. A1-2]|nr:MAG: hypothetical protein FRX49_10414 [Trebouxia sp. A1-2]
MVRVGEGAASCWQDNTVQSQLSCIMSLKQDCHSRLKGPTFLAGQTLWQGVICPQLGWWGSNESSRDTGKNSMDW